MFPNATSAVRSPLLKRMNVNLDGLGYLKNDGAE